MKAVPVQARVRDRILALFAKQGKERNIMAISRQVSRSRSQVYRVLRQADLIPLAKHRSVKKSK